MRQDYQQQMVPDPGCCSSNSAPMVMITQKLMAVSLDRTARCNFTAEFQLAFNFTDEANQKTLAEMPNQNSQSANTDINKIKEMKKKA